MRPCFVDALVGILLILFSRASAHIPEDGGSTTSDEDSLASSLNTILRNKMAEAREVILHGNPKGDLRPLDPFEIEPLDIMVQEPNGFVNVSLKKIVVRRLSNFQAKDIATNFNLMRTSVLLNFPEIQVRANYRVKGFLNPPFSQSLVDEGNFDATITEARAVWAGRMALTDDKEDTGSISLTQTAFRTYWETVSHSFRSLLRKKPLVKAGDLLQAVSTAVIEKIQRIVEESLDTVIAHVMGRGQRSWSDLFPVAPVSPPDEGEEQEHRHSIKKRQVPCENGETLDDYVDTLIRFGRRLIRFQEPLRGPNTTVKIDDMFTVFMYNTQARGASNISRKKPAYVKCTNTSTTLGLVVQLENLRVNSKYRVLQDYKLLLFNGDADIRIRDVVVLVQLTQFMENGDTRQSLDRLKIWKLGQVTVRLKGLGNLTSALSMLITHQINDDPHSMIPVAEAQIMHAARQQLNNVTIPIFSII